MDLVDIILKLLYSLQFNVQLVVEIDTKGDHWPREVFYSVTAYQACGHFRSIKTARQKKIETYCPLPIS